MPSGTPPHQSSPRLRRSTNQERHERAARRDVNPHQDDGRSTGRAAPMPPLEHAGKQIPKPPQWPGPPEERGPAQSGETIPPLPRASPGAPLPPMSRPAQPPARQSPSAGLPLGAPVVAPYLASRATTISGEQRQRNPRVLAAFAYALPIVPAALMLAREGRNRFVRLHALQAFVFYALVALAQIIVYVALVNAGNLSHSLPLAVGLFAVFLALFVIVGLCAISLWLRLMRDAMDGRRSRFAVITRCADGLDQFLAWARRVSARRAARENSPGQ